MAAVRAMALIADAWLWPTLIAIKADPNAHILDVSPIVWPRVLAWLTEAAAHPEHVIDGTHDLRASLEAGGQRVEPRSVESLETRGGRAAIDMARIRRTLAADAESRKLVGEMLAAAFSSMADGVRNHASEFLPGGRCCMANITLELREAMSGTPTTSTSAETLFAAVKRRAERHGDEWERVVAEAETQL